MTEACARPLSRFDAASGLEVERVRERTELRLRSGVETLRNA